MTSKKTAVQIQPSQLITIVTLSVAILFLGLAVASAAPTARVEVMTDTGAHTFTVEVMSSPGERAKGLMFRKSLPSDQGMLFDFAENVTIRMWMKNTYIPLDMIFIDDTGTIIDIAPNTVPHSTEIISSRQPARYVLEVIAGSSARIGAQVGNRIIMHY